MKLSHRRARRPRRTAFRLAALLGLSGLLLPRAATLRADDLLVEGPNSPYYLTSDSTYGNVTVGYDTDGVLNQSGNLLTVTNTIYVGDNGRAGIYNLDSTGRAVVGAIWLGAYGGNSNGTLNLGGNAQLTGTVSVGYEGVGVVNQSGTSTFSTANDLLYLSYFAGSTGVYNLNGGTLVTPGILGGGLSTNTSPGTNSTVNFNGGTVRVTPATVLTTGNSYDPAGGFLQGISAINVRGGGAIFDTNGSDIGINQVLAHSAFGGDAAVDGGVTKLGAGSLTLTGTNTFTGGVRANAGRVVALNNGNALGSGTMAVASGAVLELSNTSASAGVFVAGGTTFTGAGSLVKSGAGSVSFGSNGGSVTLALSPGALIDVQAGTLVGSSNFNAVYNAGGVGGAGNQAGLNIAAGATFDGVEGSVRVDALTGAGTLRGGYGTIGSVTLGVAGGSGVFTGVLADSGNNGGRLTLIKTGAGTETLAGANTYTGTTTFAGGTLAAGSAAAFGNGGTLIFNGGTMGYASGVTTDFSGRFSTASGQGFRVDTGGNNVTFATGLAGSGNTFAKLGAGVLTLSGANTYTGATTVTGGGLTVGSGGSLGDTTITVGAGAALNVTGTGTLTGNQYNLLVNGMATLASSGALSRGSVSVGDAAGAAGSLTQSSGAFTVNPQGFFYLGNGAGSTGAYTLGGTASLSAGAIAVGYNGAGSFLQTGNSTFTVGTLSLSGSNTTTAGTYRLEGGALAANNIIGARGTSTFDFNGGTLLARQDSTGFFQGVTTAEVRNGGATINTAGYNVTVPQGLVHSAVAGDATVDGGLLKLGAGTLTLTGTNTYTGGTTIRAGTLAVASDAALGAVSGDVNVTGTGALRFTGSATVGARNLNLGTSTLSAGSGNTLAFNGTTVNGGYLAAAGTYNLGNGSTLNAVTAPVGSTLVQNDGGTATLNNATVRGALNETGGTLALNNATGTTSSRVAVGGTVNATGTELDGTTTVLNGGLVNAVGTSLYFGGGARATISSGGTLAASAGTTVELNGALLVNNGAQTGALNVNYGSQARGNGSFGNVTVGQGGQFGNNAVGGGNGSTSNTLTAGLAAGAALPRIGPLPATTPGVVNVASLTLGAGSTLSFNLQNTTLPAGQGYDLTNVGNELTLQGSTAAGSQIVLRLIGLDGNGNQGSVANFDGSQSYRFTFVTTGGGIAGYTPGEFVVNTAGFSNDLQGGSFSVVPQGNNLVLVFTSAVPEPGTWTLLGLCALGIGFVSQRRRSTIRS